MCTVATRLKTSAVVCVVCVGYGSMLDWPVKHLLYTHPGVWPERCEVGESS